MRNNAQMEKQSSDDALRMGAERLKTVLELSSEWYWGAGRDLPFHADHRKDIVVALQRSGMRANLLELELTESMARILQ